MTHENEKLLDQENRDLDLNELLGSMDREPAAAPDAGELPELSEADMFGEETSAQGAAPQDAPDGAVPVEAAQEPAPKPKRSTRKKSRRSLKTAKRHRQMHLQKTPLGKIRICPSSNRPPLPLITLTLPTRYRTPAVRL